VAPEPPLVVAAVVVPVVVPEVVVPVVVPVQTISPASTAA